MPFTLIKGTFHVRSYSPDGDSMRFLADNAALIRQLDGPPAKFNGRGHVQLRLEAIDALETHYSPPSGGSSLHQPLGAARAALDRLLGFVGISNVVWDQTHTSVLSAQDGTPGYILARAVEKNGRPIAFVYAGDPPEQDGATVRLDVARLQTSYNYAALTEGLVYPTYYQGLFHDLRDAMTQAAEAARDHGRGLYEIDKTNVGFDATTLHVITEESAILPKLFRRLSEYMVNYGTAVGFKQKLAESQERVFDLRLKNFTHFDTFVEQAGGSTSIRLMRRPEELVFDEMPARPVNLFSTLMGDNPA
jgi:endonuclease YncB( thermonuclease family)